MFRFPPMRDRMRLAGLVANPVYYLGRDAAGLRRENAIKQRIWDARQGNQGADA
jgi:hypothetical protein